MQSQSCRPDDGIRALPQDKSRGPIEVAQDIWTLEADELVEFTPAFQPTYPYPIRAVVVRLADGSLWVHSPIKMTGALRAQVDALGPVKHIVSPNHIHHLYMGGWAEAYPDAQLYASPGLVAKRTDLQFHKTLTGSDPEPEWAGQIEQCVIGYSRDYQSLLPEVVFLHRASLTVIFCDLIMDFDPAILTRVGRLGTRLNKMYRQTPRMIQRLLSEHSEVERERLQTILSWQAEHLIIDHSPWLCVDGEERVRAFLTQAFKWLQPPPAYIPAPLVKVFRDAWFFALIKPAYLTLRWLSRRLS